VIDLFGNIRTLRRNVSTVMGINARNRHLVYPNNPRRHFKLADDKLLTKQRLQEKGIPVPETLHFFRFMHELRDAGRILGPFSDFVVKPAQGKAGSGILVFVGRSEPSSTVWLDSSGQAWDHHRIARHIGNILFGNYAHGLNDRAIIEKRLIQAPLFGEAKFPGLPDIRVITLDGNILMAMARVPTRNSGGKANLHQGALGVGIDLETGSTTHASFKGRSVTEHPDGLGSVLDRAIYGWPDIKNLARRTAAAFPLGYLGIDIALDVELGPVVLEINVRPGLEIQNVNGIGLNTRLLSSKTGEVNP